MDINKHVLKWNNLLSKGSINSHLYIDEYNKDKKRVNEIYNIKYRRVLDVELESLVQLDALRRLENKTQVFAFKGDGKVRTRLTHSLDAMNVGICLGTIIFNTLKHEYNKLLKDHKLDEKKKDFFDEIKYLESLPFVLRNAALIHDIGNPPFGHRGEDLISNWTEKNIQKYYINKKTLEVTKMVSKNKSDYVCLKSLIDCGEYRDLMHFEGNAELLRVFSKLSYFMNDGISIATMSACMKYIAQIENMNKNDKYLGFHKLGYYYSEKEIVDLIQKEVGTKRRNPTAFLLEACDDIAYRLHDIDDCIKSGHISLADFLLEIRNAFEKEIKTLKDEKRIAKTGVYKNILEILCKIVGMNETLTTNLDEICFKLIDQLKSIDRPYLKYEYEKLLSFLRIGIIESVAKEFTDKIDEIMSDQFNQELCEVCDFSFVFSASRSIMENHIYKLYEVRSDEISEYKIVDVLMDNLIKAVFNKKTLNSKPIVGVYIPLDIFISKRFFEAADKEIAKKISDLNKELKRDELRNYVYYKLRCVVDNIAGMTDNYALKVYKKMQALID